MLLCKEQRLRTGPDSRYQKAQLLFRTFKPTDLSLGLRLANCFTICIYGNRPLVPLCFSKHFLFNKLTNVANLR
jgi:hypothetical protein